MILEIRPSCPGPPGSQIDSKAKGQSASWPNGAVSHLTAAPDLGNTKGQLPRASWQSKLKHKWGSQPPCCLLLICWKHRCRRPCACIILARPKPQFSSPVVTDHTHSRSTCLRITRLRLPPPALSSTCSTPGPSSTALPLAVLPTAPCKGRPSGALGWT